MAFCILKAITYLNLDVIMVDEATKRTLAQIPLLKTKAGPRDGELWVTRLKEEYQSLIKVHLIYHWHLSVGKPTNHMFPALKLIMTFNSLFTTQSKVVLLSFFAQTAKRISISYLPHGSHFLFYEWKIASLQSTYWDQSPKWVIIRRVGYGISYKIKIYSIWSNTYIVLLFYLPNGSHIIHFRLHFS